MAATLEPRTAPGERPATHGHFRRDIEGLRAIAVGGVILFHCEVGPFGGGFAGVDVFFVISGYLITQVLLRDAAGNGISILRFYARRARRLLPAATLLILATLAAALVMQPPITRAATAADARSAILFFSNFHFAHLATDYFNQGRAPSLFQHFWSLSVEEQFYFVWPTVLMVAMIGVRGEQRRRRLLAVAVGITAGSFAYAALRVGAEPTRTFFSPFARAWELGAGASLALAEPAMRRLGATARQLLVTVGLGLIGFTFLAFDAGAGFPGWRALFPVIGTAAVIAGGIGGTTTVARVTLEPWPMQFVGRFSYSLYLWHWPVIILLAMRDDGTVASKKAVLAMALIALPAAWISYRLVEAPVRSGRMFAHSRTAVTGAVVLLTVSVIVATTYGAAAESLDAGVASKGSGPLDYVPSNIHPTLFDAYSHADNGWPCADKEVCTFGDLESNRTVALVGDSHTRMWGAAYADIGERLRVRMLGMGADGCRSFGERPYRTGKKECEAWRELVLDRLAAEKPDVVVFSDHAYYQFGVSPAVWETLVRDTLRRLAPETKVVFVGQTPYARQNIPECLSEHVRNTAKCEPRGATLTRTEAINDGLARIAGDTGARFVDVTPVLCPGGRCAVVVGNELVYRDDNHVTRVFSRRVEPAIEAGIREALQV